MTRWHRQGGADPDDYDARWERLAAAGHDPHGEASLVTSLGAASVLDAGCGTGRVAIELARRGVDVVGVDLDARFLDTARAKAPALRWVHADLLTVDLGRTFDVVVMAGNVAIFLEPGSEAAVVANLARHLGPGGRLVAGFQLPGGSRGGTLTVDAYDDLARAARLTPGARYATWQGAPWSDGDDYVVAVHTAPAPPG